MAEESNPPYKGTLCVLLQTGEKLDLLKQESQNLQSFTLKPRQICDLGLLLNGAFSPLTGFLNEADYNGVVEQMRLADGTLWPIPITLDFTKEQADKVKLGERICLRDLEGNLLAVMTVDSIWQPDKVREAVNVFGANDEAHPSVFYLFHEAGDVYLGGKVEGVQLPIFYDFTELRLTPTELRAQIKAKFWKKVVGFQTRNPMHRSHRELTLRAAKEAQANLLVHPVVGMTKPGDVDHYTRVRCYKEIMKHYPSGMAMLSLLPLAMRMAGPKEAILHAIIRKNYGCTHFIVGRDHAGPGNNSKGEPFYGYYDAQELLCKHADEIGIIVLKYQMVVYVEELSDYRCVDEVPSGMRVMNISGTDLRRRLYRGIDIPEWFSYPSVVKILRQSYPPRKEQGFTILLTGLSGAGKSTIAQALRSHLLEDGSRTVTLLDGDEVRTHLSSELSFTKEHRDLNIRRTAYVSSVITKSRGVALMANIAPYRAARDYARNLISQYGGFVEVYISTPLEVCEMRETSGLYKKARKGELQQVSGLDDPYEPPLKPELTIDTTITSVREAVHEIVLYLEQEGFLGK